MPDSALPVSVVVSAHNYPEHVESAVRSILNQSTIDFEFLITEDVSMDQTTAILERLAVEAERIVLNTRENKGLTLSLIEACAQARGWYIARQDADERSEPHRLAKLTGRVARYRSGRGYGFLSLPVCCPGW